MTSLRPYSSQLLSSLALCEGIGALCYFLSINSFRNWYSKLELPPIAPPDWFWSVSWPILFGFLGLALAFYRAAPADSAPRKTTLVWFWLLLGLSLLWAITFFGLQASSVGYMMIFALWFAVVAILWVGSRVSSRATWMVVPFFAVVTYLSAFNFGVMSLNVIKPRVQKMDADPRNQDDFFLMKKPDPTPTPPIPEPLIGN